MQIVAEILPTLPDDPGGMSHLEMVEAELPRHRVAAEAAEVRAVGQELGSDTWAGYGLGMSGAGVGRAVIAPNHKTPSCMVQG